MFATSDARSGCVAGSLSGNSMPKKRGLVHTENAARKPYFQFPGFRFSRFSVSCFPEIFAFAMEDVLGDMAEARVQGGVARLRSRKSSLPTSPMGHRALPQASPPKPAAVGKDTFPVVFEEGPLGLTIEVEERKGKKQDGGVFFAAKPFTDVVVQSVSGASLELGVRPGAAIVAIGGHPCENKSVDDTVSWIKSLPRPLTLELRRSVNSVVAFSDFEPRRARHHKAGSGGSLEPMSALLDRVNEAVVTGKWDVVSVETIKVTAPDSSVFEINPSYDMQVIRVWYRVTPFHQGLAASTMLPMNYSGFGTREQHTKMPAGDATGSPRFSRRRSISLNV